MLVLLLDEALDRLRRAVGGRGSADEENVQGWAGLDGMLVVVN